MSDDKQRELERQLEAEREHSRKLEAEASALWEKAAYLENALENYKPLAVQWMREHGPTREECEKELTEMLAHPESWVNVEDVLKELERDFGDKDK